MVRFPWVSFSVQSEGLLSCEACDPGQQINRTEGNGGNARTAKRPPTHEAVREILCPPAEGDEYLADFGKHLQAAGYTKRVSIECRYADFVKDINTAYPFMRATFA